MRGTKGAAVLAVGLVSLIVIFMCRALGEPTKQATPATAGQPSSNEASPSEQQQPDPAAGKELSPEELQTILEPIFRDARKAAKPAKETADESRKIEPYHKSFASRVAARTRDLVSRAMSYVGVRYRWGGTSRNGIDCSGLTRLIYLKEGVNLPHKARLQFRMGKPVARKDLLPGDLVFFNTRGLLTHVGIYIGSGKFIHAANRRRGVRVDYLSTPYYARRYAGARRYKGFD